MVNITKVDLLRLATSFSYVNQLDTVGNSTNDIQFISYDDAFLSNVLGSNVSQELVKETSWAAFHEAGVYNVESGKLYATSNRGDTPINVTAYDPKDRSVESLHYNDLTMANGGCAYYPPGTPANSSEGQAIVFCDQGDLDHPAQLVLVDPAKNTSRVLINNFFGRNFTSPNDVIQHPYTGDLWFTDPYYAFWQGFRPEPDVRQQVYRFEPLTGVVQAVADGFYAVNGIEFSPDYKHVYVTDTGFITYPNGTNYANPATVYRYDITPDGKRLGNRQLFAYSDNGLPDGIHTDTSGNVFVGCGDGVHVWDPSGVLLGKLAVAGGAANFAFFPGGLYLFNEDKLFHISLKAEGRTVARDFGLGGPERSRDHGNSFGPIDKASGLFGGPGGLW